MSIAFPRNPVILSTDLPNKLVLLIDVAIPLMKSPRDPVIFKTLPVKPNNFPTSVATAETIFVTTLTPSFITEKRPLNVDFSLADCLLFNLNFEVRSRIRSVISINCLAVIGGNISLKASLIGFIILIKPSKEFLRDSTSIVRPPPLAQSPTILLRASDELLIISLSTSETDVQSSLASSKSPIINLQVVVHPEPRASFKVSINCVKVLTFVAAFPAVLAISAICFACSSVYP